MPETGSTYKIFTNVSLSIPFSVYAFSTTYQSFDLKAFSHRILAYFMYLS